MFHQLPEEVIWRSRSRDKSSSTYAGRSSTMTFLTAWMHSAQCTLTSNAETVLVARVSTIFVSRVPYRDTVPTSPDFHDKFTSCSSWLYFIIIIFVKLYRTHYIVRNSSLLKNWKYWKTNGLSWYFLGDITSWKSCSKSRTAAIMNISCEKNSNYHCRAWYCMVLNEKVPYFHTREKLFFSIIDTFPYFRSCTTSPLIFYSWCVEVSGACILTLFWMKWSIYTASIHQFKYQISLCHMSAMYVA